MERRTFIRAAGAAGLSTFSRLGAGAEPPSLVTLLEDTPRERLGAELATRIRGGLREQELIAALATAAARNVQPVPHVGFKYHSLMMLRSAQLAVAHLTPAEHWLPLLWAADYFKEAQADEHAAGGWHQSPRSTSGTSAAARDELTAALDRWDIEAADAALVSSLRGGSSSGLSSTLFWYGARDTRDIGHKAISVANAHRLMSALDPQQTESVLRSTVAALQTATGEPNPASHDLEPDRPFRRNVQLLGSLPASWKQGRDDAGARADLRATLYRASNADAGAAAAELLRRGISPDALWRVLFDTAAELILVKPSVVTLHAQTSANALHYAYRMCAGERTQQLALLQCAAYVAMFRATTGASERDCHLETLQPLATTGDALAELAADLSADQRMTAARKALGYLQRGGDPAMLMAWVRHNVAYYADDPHDFKYSEAVFENYANASDVEWRRRCLSAGMGLYRAPARQPNAVVAEALQLLHT
jgi:hypothetical protein